MASDNNIRYGYKKLYRCYDFPLYLFISATNILERMQLNLFEYLHTIYYILFRWKLANDCCLRSGVKFEYSSIAIEQ